MTHLCHSALSGLIATAACALTALTGFAAVPARAPTPAPAPAPVHWQVTSAPHSAPRPGQKFTITVTGRIDPGWHVYALEEPDGGPVATQVALEDDDPADLLRVSSGKPETLQDPQFNMQTALFVNSVAFTMHLQGARSAATPGPPTLHVLIRYQSCNDQVCLPPHTDTVPVELAKVKLE